MYTGFGAEEFPEFLTEDTEDTEDTEFFHFDEAAGRPGRGPRGRLPTAKKGNPVPQQAGQGYATKAELQATAQRLDGRIATNSKAITTLDGRTRVIETETGKIGSALKKEIAERKTVTEALRRGLDESRQIAMLMPLLSTQDTISANIGPNNSAVNVVVDSGDKFSKILPILLLSGGFGGSTSTPGAGQTGGLFGGDGGIGSLSLIMALTGK
jgi:hypothetical protein